MYVYNLHRHALSQRHTHVQAEIDRAIETNTETPVCSLAVFYIHQRNPTPSLAVGLALL